MNSSLSENATTADGTLADFPAPIDPLLADREICATLGCARSTFWKWVQEGTFPRPLKFGGMSRWKASDVSAFIADASAKREAARSAA